MTLGPYYSKKSICYLNIYEKRHRMLIFGLVNYEKDWQVQSNVSLAISISTTPFKNLRNVSVYNACRKLNKMQRTPYIIILSNT